MAVDAVLDIQGLLDAALEFPAEEPFPEPAIITVPETIRFSTRGIAPPANLYLRHVDQLVIQLRNSVANAEIVVTGRMVTTEGAIRPFQRILRPTADRTPDSTFIFIGEGWLLNLSVHTQTVNILRGQCFVLGFYIAGLSTSDQITAIILSDYVYTDYVVSYPFGLLKGPDSERGTPRVIIGTNPAAGSEASETVPTRAWWQLPTLAVQLVSDATSAARNVRLIINAGGSNELIVRASNTQSLSLTRRYDFFVGAPWGVGGDLGMHAPLPQDLYLPAGTTIGTNTDLLQAGDDFGSPQLSVNEWIEN